MNLEIRLSVMQRSSYYHWFKSRAGVERSLFAFSIATRHITRRQKRLMWDFLHKLQHHVDVEVSVGISSPL
jgi:hypothetical protein